jgi:hypothetical protein
MLYLSAGVLMLCLAVLGDRPRIRDHVVTFGVGLGALLAGLLICVPATGTALATPFARAGGGLVKELIVGQAAWILTACLGLLGYLLSRAGRRLRSTRALTGEAVGVAAAAALLPATTGHLAFVVALVPAAAAGLIATLLEEQERPSIVLAGLLGVGAFVLVFAAGRALPPLGLPYLLVSVVALAYMVGRWADVHPASMAKAGVPLWVSLAGSFLATYRL